MERQPFAVLSSNVPHSPRASKWAPSPPAKQAPGDPRDCLRSSAEDAAHFIASMAPGQQAMASPQSLPPTPLEHQQRSRLANAQENIVPSEALQEPTESPEVCRMQLKGAAAHRYGIGAAEQAASHNHSGTHANAVQAGGTGSTPGIFSPADWKHASSFGDAMAAAGNASLLLPQQRTGTAQAAADSEATQEQQLQQSEFVAGFPGEQQQHHGLDDSLVILRNSQGSPDMDLLRPVGAASSQLLSQHEERPVFSSSISPERLAAMASREDAEGTANEPQHAQSAAQLARSGSGSSSHAGAQTLAAAAAGHAGLGARQTLLEAPLQGQALLEDRRPEGYPSYTEVLRRAPLRPLNRPPKQQQRLQAQQQQQRPGRPAAPVRQHIPPAAAAAAKAPADKKGALTFLLQAVGGVRACRRHAHACARNVCFVET